MSPILPHGWQPLYLMCADRVGPVPKLGDVVLWCELEHGHEGVHRVTGGTWWT